MRILVVVHTFPPASEAGSEIYARDLALAMGRGGDRLLVLTRESDGSRPEYASRTERRDGLTIVWINNTFAAARSFEDAYEHEAIAAIAARVIDDFAPDVAHLHHLTCLSTRIVDALAARGVPMVATLHDYWLMCHRGQLLDRNYRVCAGPGEAGCGACVGPEAGVGTAARRGARLVGARAASVARRLAPLASDPERLRDAERQRVRHMRDVCDQVSRFIAPSQALRNRFVEFGVPAERIQLSRYGFDTAPFGGAPRQRSDRLRIGFLGTLMVSKAPDVLLEAVGQLPAGAVSVDLFGAPAAYHGDNGYRATLGPLLARDGVHAHGQVPHASVRSALSTIDVLVVPSIWPENSPLVISEAFLSGVPVVGSRIGGIPELIEDGRNGLLFAPGNAQDLARALRRLIDEPGLLAALRAGAAATPVRTIDHDAAEMRRRFDTLIEVPAARPRLAAIVLNYRTADDTRLAVASLRASRREIADIIVVDNASADGAALADLGPRVTLIRAPRNLGYSGGMNLGIREALRRDAARVLLVNSDVIVPPDCVERLERSLSATPRAGIAGPRILARADPDFIASGGMSYAPGSGRMRHAQFGDRVVDDGLSGDRVVDGVSGCLMLVAREVFDAIGLLDEDYFFSFEDLDFCLRARRAGYVTVLSALAAAHHEGGRSIGARSPRRLYFAARGHLLLARRAGPPAGPLASAWRTASIVALNLAHAVRSTGAALPVRVGAVARGVSDYFAGRFGPDRDALV